MRFFYMYFRSDLNFFFECLNSDLKMYFSKMTVRTYNKRKVFFYQTQNVSTQIKKKSISHKTVCVLFWVFVFDFSYIENYIDYRS